MLREHGRSNTRIPKITVVVLCYGLFGEKFHRTAKEMEGLKQYFRDCADYIASLYKQGRLSGVVLCGGITNPKLHPNISEASTSATSLWMMLAVRDIPVKEINICLEEQSHNTAQNLFFAVQMLTGFRQPFSRQEFHNATKGTRDRMLQHEKRWQALSHDVVFICDRYRWLKVRLILRWIPHFSPEKLHLSVKSIPRQDIHPNSCWSKQLLAALLYLLRPNRFLSDLKVGQSSTIKIEVVKPV